MLEVYELLANLEPGSDAEVLALDHLQREKGRFKTFLADGTEVRVFLERGNVLHLGQGLRSACGRRLVVAGATESVVLARTDDWSVFAGACYHLGNRHVRLQIGERWLRMTPDHVLEEMLVKLGLEVVHQEAVFEPESGAYSGAGHAHHHH